MATVLIGGLNPLAREKRLVGSQQKVRSTKWERKQGKRKQQMKDQQHVNKTYRPNPFCISHMLPEITSILENTVWFDFSDVMPFHLTLEREGREGLELDHWFVASVVPRYPKLGVFRDWQTEELHTASDTVVCNLTTVRLFTTLLLHQYEAPGGVEDLTQLPSQSDNMGHYSAYSGATQNRGHVQYCPQLTSLGICIVAGYLWDPKVQPDLSFPVLWRDQFRS